MKINSELTANTAKWERENIISASTT